MLSWHGNFAVTFAPHLLCSVAKTCERSDKICYFIRRINNAPKSKFTIIKVKWIEVNNMQTCK